MTQNNNTIKRALLILAAISAIYSVISLVFKGSEGVSLFSENKNSIKKNEVPSLFERANKEADAIDFILNDINGKKITFSEFKNKNIILNFWGTWCPPCQEELPSFVAFSKWAESEGIVVVAVSNGDQAKDIYALFKKMKIQIPNQSIRFLVDSGEGIAKKYGVFQFPETFFLDKNFKIVRKWVGAQDWNSSMTKSWISEKIKL